jgi:transcriptional regulator with XRE-family HTH domain
MEVVMKAAHVLRSDPSKVLTTATLRAATHLALGGSELARIIGTSPSTISRLVSGLKSIDPQSKEGEMSLLVVRLYRSLDALVGNDSQRRIDWMASHNHAFNAVPRDYIQSAQGLVTVVNYLDGLRATV